LAVPQFHQTKVDRGPEKGQPPHQRTCMRARPRGCTHHLRHEWLGNYGG
jgi:hypothetical protein